GGGPGRRRDAADLPPARTVSVEERVVRGPGALDIEPGEPEQRRAAVLRKERAPAGEVSLAEIDAPAEPQLERRPRRAGAQGVHARDEIDVGEEEPCLEP